MPTRKQRRRAAKEKRHEYETVWVDAEGNELEEPPEDGATQRHVEHRNGKAPAQKTQARGGRRVPQPPSWSRALKRSVPWTLALAVFLIWTSSRSKSGNIASAVLFSLIYVVLFPPLIYWIDSNMWKRYQRQQSGGGQKPTPKKR